MTVRTAAPSELVPLIKSRDPEAFERFDKLCRAERLDPGLCFIAEEDGIPKGALVLILVPSGDITAAFAVCDVRDEDHTIAQLYEHAFILLREKGVPFIFAKRPSADDKLYYDRLKWEWIVPLGFVPPSLDDSALLYAGKRLDPEAGGSCLPLELPEELGLPSPVCISTAEHRVTVEELARECYITRQRRRLAERAALVIFLIALAVIAAFRKDFPRSFLYILPMMGIGLVLLYRNIFRPKKVVAEVVEAFSKRGKTETDDRYFFGEDAFICFTGRRGHSIRFYSGIIQVYVKPGFIFLVEKSDENSATGFYVSEASLSDKQAFLGHIRAKAPGAVFKK